jgi:predicted glutamine amidotransferase
MTCRMLIAVGQFPVRQLLDDFKLMALNRNEAHERNRNNPNYLHDNGWGIVLGKSGNLKELYKKDIPCWKDPRFLKYYDAKPDFVMVHARRASDKNLVNLSFTHPFERDGWYFCHNGTVTDLKSKEKNDSEQFFALLLSSIKKHSIVGEAVKNTVDKIKEYTALNCILANKAFVYILVKYQENPEYYTMKYLENKNYIIVSSEVLPNFNGEWKKLSNSTLLELDIAHRRLITLIC